MKTLIIGASSNPERYSYKALHRLIENNHEVVAIGIKKEVVSGISIETGFPVYTDIDTVTLYLNPLRQQEYYDYIIQLKPKRLVFNPGTENPDFYKLLKQSNIQAQEACTLVLLATNQY